MTCSLKHSPSLRGFSLIAQAPTTGKKVSRLSITIFFLCLDGTIYRPALCLIFFTNLRSDLMLF